jgi:hypothetical protein
MKTVVGLLVAVALVALGCGGGSDEVSEPTTTSLVKNAVLTTSTSVPATTTTQAPTTTAVPTTTVQASTTTAATTSTLPTVSTVEIELSDASAEVEEVTISLEAEVHIQVGGFKPFSVVTIELHSEPVELVVAVADADGWIDVKATIPEDTDVGEHEIHIDGVDASDEPVEILIPAEIVEVAPTAAEATTTTVASTTTAAPVFVVDEESILTFAYVWGSSEEAAALQTLLGLTADGWYGPGTQAAHIAELEARGLPTDDVPNSPPTTTTTTTTTTAHSTTTGRARPGGPRTAVTPPTETTTAPTATTTASPPNRAASRSP